MRNLVVAVIFFNIIAVITVICLYIYMDVCVCVLACALLLNEQ